MNDFLINQAFELRGYWSLPSTEQYVAGTLKYSEDGISLELFGSLSDKELFSLKSVHFDVVHGSCEGGHEITLVDGFEEDIHMSGIITSRLVFNTMFVGKCINHNEGFIFDSAEISLSNIEEWTGRQVLKYAATIDQQDGSPAYSIMHTSQDDIVLNVAAIDSEILISHNFKLERGLTTGIMRYEERLILKPFEEMPYEWFEEKIFDLRGLFSLLANRPLNIRQIVLRGKNEANGRRIERIQVFPGKILTYPERDLRSNELFVSLPRILPIAESVFNKWFDKAISSTKRLYLNTLYHDEGDTVYVFINLAKAIESFHRDLHGERAQYLTNSKHRTIRRKMIKAVSEELEPDVLSKYREALAYAHHYEFEKRIFECFGDMENKIKSIIFSDEMINHLATRVKRTRNYHTHYGTRQKGVIEEGLKLLHVNVTLKTVIFYHLCKYLGITDDTLYSALSEDYNLMSILGVAKDIAMEDFADPSNGEDS